MVFLPYNHRYIQSKSNFQLHKRNDHQGNIHFNKYLSYNDDDDDEHNLILINHKYRRHNRSIQ